MKKAILVLFSFLALTSCTENYSEGERVGIITKFSSKGLIWKSWEGDLKVAPNIANGNGMVGQYEDFLFSIDNNATINCSTPIDSINKYMQLGIPVTITYQEVWGKNITGSRGETNHFVKSVTRANK